LNGATEISELHRIPFEVTSNLQMSLMDDKHTSTRLRSAAVEALKDTQRPMSAHEIESWIRERDAEFATEIAAKCYDYTRIILSLMPSSMICKYHCRGPIPGVDSRSTFYGLPNHSYDDEKWTQGIKAKRKDPASKPRRKPTERRNRPQKVHPPITSIFTTGPPAVMAIPCVDPTAYSNAWLGLSTLVDRGDFLWPALLTTIEPGQSDSAIGSQSHEAPILTMGDNRLVQNPIFSEEVVTLLRKESEQKPDQLWFTDILDNIL
jgi:hypothetical protein